MKKIITYIAIVLGLSFGSACTDGFDELNTDPNNPTNISPQYLLPYAIERTVDRYWGGNVRFERLNIDGMMLWMQYLSRNIYSNEGDNYGITPTFYNNTWKSFYNDGLVNFQRIIAQSKSDGPLPNTNYEGIALVMRSWTFMLLADIYGPIPYTEAIKGTDSSPIYTPSYDSMGKVYTGLLKDLKEANDKLKVGGPVVSGDIMYSGDILKWKKFANSLMVRLANRQAVKKPAESKAILNEILSDPAKYPVFTSNADNAILKNTDARPSNNEWHEVMIIGGRTDWNLSKTLVDKLLSLNDSRLMVFGSPVKGVFEGIPNGLPDAIATTYLSSAATLGSYFTAASAPSVLMTYSELMLDFAEAGIDGDVNINTEEYLKKGVTASFAQFGATMPSDYLNKLTTDKPTILDQKWIALFGQGVESWTEYRRTGYPILPGKDPRAVFENNGILPTRLPYPTTEYSLNKARLDEGIKLLGPDNMQSKLWWSEK